MRLPPKNGLALDEKTSVSSYIDPQAQQLIDQINATLSAWQANQSLWSTALGQTHTRDALGRITHSSEVLLGQGQPAKSYQYDTAGRLTRASQGAITTTWGYDANGNRTHENGQAIASYDSQDRLITWKGATYQYNGAGDLSKKNQCRRRHHLQLRGIEHAKVRASPYSRQFVA